MFSIVHERNAPHNAFRFELTKFKHIGRIGVEFFHPGWPDPEREGIEAGAWRTAKLEADIKDAIKLRDALTQAIDEILLFHGEKLEDAVAEAASLKGEKLKNLLNAYMSTSWLRQAREIEELKRDDASGT